ncbi:hypothetical protein GRI40_06140 [Altererythrobacter aerius]|uniref:Porin n=1 Tax=Tsuneonella aeria TaxID=1837929 RepID=A0A6I4TBB0_9SPHN|nr:TorF family putative porin [Tsuneonella aeria]MXO74799.1 hypothetical protein [Tsuneonella aeria]
MRFSRVAQAALLATTTITMAGSALAQDILDPRTTDADSPGAAESGPVSISANVSLVSDYRFRGVSFSAEDPAIQGGVDFSHKSGFYLGTWASSVEDSALYGNTEIDIYAGWSGDVAPEFSIDAGLLYYFYPNGDDLAGDSGYFEPYASLTKALGPVEATVGAAYAFEQGSALPSDNIYVYGDLSAGISETPLTLSAHLGHSEGSLDYGSGGYLDWSLSASYSLDILTLGIAYVDTDLPDIAGQNSTILFSIGAAF